MSDQMIGIDRARVDPWLAEHVEGVRPPFEYEPIAGGRSNLTYTVVDADGTKFVLRRPPTGSVLATAHDMAREHAIISAVGTTDVPVAPALALCTDEQVNGAPFYVMGFVEGVVLDSPEKAEDLRPEVRRHAAEQLFDVLGDLHALDVDEIGLGGLAKRTGYVERQVRRWSTQWEKSKTRELPVVDEVARLLSDRIPEQRGVSIAHGDYRFGNCLIDPTTGSLQAVLDWELCTLGDPLADVGYVGVYWTDPGATSRRANDPTGLDGFPRYDDMLERYAARTGRDVSDISYYVAFGSFRLAVISEGVYARYVHGAMGDQQLDPAIIAGFQQGTEELAESALSALRR